MTAMRSPSWTTSPSATCRWVSVPEPSASTGISIFIDSRMTRVSPSETSAPSAATTFHTFATISARTSATRGSFPLSGRPPQPPVGPAPPATIVLAARSGPQLGDDGRVVVPASELLAGQEVSVERQVCAQTGDLEHGHRVPRPGQRLRPVRPVRAQLGEQGVVERGHLVPRRIPGVHPDTGAGRLLPPLDGPGAGQEPHRVLGIDPQFQRMPLRPHLVRVEGHRLAGGDAELLLHQVD